MYGCENCIHHKVWYSNDYWSPDEHDCVVPQGTEPQFELSDDELDDAFTRVWERGETWKNSEEQICPYYERYLGERY